MTAPDALDPREAPCRKLRAPFDHVAPHLAVQQDDAACFRAGTRERRFARTAVDPAAGRFRPGRLRPPS